MSDGPTVGAAERARVLQEHLVRTAYALHFTAADLAAQHENRADAQMPSGIDHRLQAKRWLALSDHALDIVRRWDRRTDADASGPSSQDGRLLVRPRRPLPEEALDLAHSAIQRLFRASLTLHAVMPVASDLVHDRLLEAADELEWAVRDIRQFAIDVRKVDEQSD